VSYGSADVIIMAVLLSSGYQVKQTAREGC